MNDIYALGNDIIKQLNKRGYVAYFDEVRFIDDVVDLIFAFEYKTEYIGIYVSIQDKEHIEYYDSADIVEYMIDMYNNLIAEYRYSLN